MYETDSDNTITIICDNGGGITLQVINTEGQEYQHFYNDNAGQCIDDVIAALGGDNPMSWDGNDLDNGVDILSVSYDNKRNGGYRELSCIETLNDIITWDKSGWHNCWELADLAKKNIRRVEGKKK